MSNPSSEPQTVIPAGVICLTTYGQIQAETVQSLINMQAHLFNKGLAGHIRFDFVQGNLVDKARNEGARRMLESEGQYIWFLDCDMVWEPDLVEHILMAAYGSHVEADIIGGYCNLKGPPFLPTIDTGTGTWEPHPAGIGVLPVIRTGAACLLIKRPVFEKMPYPWFGIRAFPQPVEAMAEVDGFARQLFDNRNPFADLPEWHKLLGIAADRSAAEKQRNPNLRHDMFGGTVGEDSNFCDHAKAAGFNIVVNTNAICRHLEKRPIGPEQHFESIKEGNNSHKLAAGIMP